MEASFGAALLAVTLRFRHPEDLENLKRSFIRACSSPNAAVPLKLDTLAHDMLMKERDLEIEDKDLKERFG